VAETAVKFVKNRSDVFLTTKVFHTEHGTAETRAAVEDSLRATKLEYFDLVLLHSPNAGKEKRLEAYKVLQDFYDSGKIKNIGVSSFGVKHLEELKEAGLTTPGRMHCCLR